MLVKHADILPYPIVYKEPLNKAEYNAKVLVQEYTIAETYTILLREATSELMNKPDALTGMTVREHRIRYHRQGQEGEHSS